jgi:hypothetical protein
MLLLRAADRSSRLVIDPGGKEMRLLVEVPAAVAGVVVVVAAVVAVPVPLLSVVLVLSVVEGAVAANVAPAVVLLVAAVALLSLAPPCSEPLLDSSWPVLL